MSDYNGWTNRETWLVNLWFLDGVDEPMDAEALQELVEEYVDSVIGENGFIRDMVDMGCINWRELAEHMEGES